MSSSQICAPSQVPVRSTSNRPGPERQSRRPHSRACCQAREPLKCGAWFVPPLSRPASRRSAPTVVEPAPVCRGGQALVSWPPPCSRAGWSCAGSRTRPATGPLANRRSGSPIGSVWSQGTLKENSGQLMCHAGCPLLGEKQFAAVRAVDGLLGKSGTRRFEDRRLSGEEIVKSSRQGAYITGGFEFR